MLLPKLLKLRPWASQEEKMDQSERVKIREKTDQSPFLRLSEPNVCSKCKLLNAKEKDCSGSIGFDVKHTELSRILRPVISFLLLCFMLTSRKQEVLVFLDFQSNLCDRQTSPLSPRSLCFRTCPLYICVFVCMQGYAKNYWMDYHSCDCGMGQERTHSISLWVRIRE